MKSKNSNNIVWSGKPSQWINLNVFAGAFIILIGLSILENKGIFDDLFSKPPILVSYKTFFKLVLFLSPLFFIIWRWLQVSFHSYELTEETFRENYGVFNRVSQELELYRVNDTLILKPFALNIMGLGKVILHTTDASDPVVTINAIKNSDKVREIIRNYVEKQRARKGILEFGNR